MCNFNLATRHSPKVDGFLFIIFAVYIINRYKMINIKDLYDTTLDLISKNNGEHLGVDEFNRYVRMASLELFDDLVGSKNNPRVVYGKNRITDRRLDGFRDTEIKDVPKNNRLVLLPTSLEFIRSVIDLDSKEFKGLEPIDEDRVGRVFVDTLASPNKDDKYYIELDGAIKILNDDIKRIEINYLKKPTTPKYAIKMAIVGGRERPMFDEDNSVNLLEWNERESTEIVTRILAKVGLSMKDGFVVQAVNNNLVNE